MRKQNKLVTVNKHNKNLFSYGGIYSPFATFVPTGVTAQKGIDDIRASYLPAMNISIPSLSVQSMIDDAKRVRPSIISSNNSLADNARGYYAYPYINTAMEDSNIANNGRAYYADESLYNSDGSSATYNKKYAPITLNLPAVEGFPKNNLADNFVDDLYKPNLSVSPNIDWTNKHSVKAALDAIPKLTSGINIAKGIAKAGNIGATKTPFFKTSAGGAVAGLAGSLVGKLAYKGLSNGLSSNEGQILNAAGDIAGSVLQFIPGVGAVAKFVVPAAVGALAGGVNAAIGSKKNYKNMALANANIGQNKAAADEAAKAQTSAGLLDASRHMASPLDLRAKDYKRVGFLRTNNREGWDYVNNVNSARELFKHGLALGENNIARNYKEDALVNSAALGGLLNMGNIDPATAIGYDLLHQNALSRDTQANAKGNTFTNLFAGAPNVVAKGGRIEIKHPGRLTALKKRTGKTEAELYNDGNPEHKKMVVFARNARKWKKAYGGFLDAADNLFALGGELTESNDATYIPKPLLTKVNKPISKTEYALADVHFDKDGKPYIPSGYGKKKYISKAEANRRALSYRERRVTEELEKQQASILSQWENRYGAPSTTFAFGGNLEKNGADYPTGLIHIDEGGSHEENPYQGVQMGVDPQGTPNLVEEGETIWNDYVFSNRIFADGGTLKKFHLNEKREITYADLAKKLEKEISERPNDPISQAAFDRQMAMLAEEQERQKQEEQAREAQEAFAQLPPEEQVALMQQEQQAQEQGMEEQAAQEQMMQQQPSEEEMMAQQMAAQQQMPPQGIMPQGITPDMIAQQGMPMVGAYGGLLNQYGYGGNLFRWGGKKKGKHGVLSWLTENHPELTTKERAAVTQAMENRARANKKMYNYIRGKGEGWGEFDYERMWKRSINKKFTADKAFYNWIQAGLSPDIAFHLVFGKRPDGNANTSEAVRRWDANYDKYVSTSLLTGNKPRWMNPFKQHSLREEDDEWLQEHHPELSQEERKKLVEEMEDAYVSGDLAHSFGYDMSNDEWLQKMYDFVISKRQKSNNSLKNNGTNANTRKDVQAQDQIEGWNRIGNWIREENKKTEPHNDILGNVHPSQKAATKANTELFKKNPQIRSDWDALKKAGYSDQDAFAYIRSTYDKSGNRMDSSTGTTSAIEDTLLSNPNQVADTLLNQYYQPAPSQSSAPATLAPAPVPQGQGVSLESAVAQVAAQDNPAQAPASTTATTPTVPVNLWDNADLSLGQRILTSLDKRTWNDFMDWAKENKLKEGLLGEDLSKTNWENVLADATFRDALGKLDDTTLADAIVRGYDYGNYKYVPKPGDIQSINDGNWNTSKTAKDIIDSWNAGNDELWSEIRDKVNDQMSREELEQLMMGTKAWQNTTKYLKESPDHMLNYLQAIASTEGAPKSALTHLEKFTETDNEGNLKWKDKYAKMKPDELYQEVFGKVRHTYPGSYWHSFTPATQGEDTLNFIQDKNGNWAPLETGTDGLTLKRQYKYANDKGNHTLNYYISGNGNAVEKDAANKAIEELAEGKYDIKPRHRDNWMRYAPLFGAPINLGLMAAEVGKPKLGRYDAALAGYEPVTATYEPVGGYMAYSPMDIWAAQNSANAQARAISREIVNNASPIGQRMAGDIALAYNNDVNEGKRHREAMEYDDKLRQATTAHNLGVDVQNAQAFNALSQYNASALNNYRQNLAGLRLNIADKKNEAEADWYNQLYGNIGQGLTALGKIGNENEQFNMMAELAALGVFGPMNPRSAWGSRFFEIVPRDETTGQAAKGGKIRRRKGGLTY